MREGHWHEHEQVSNKWPGLAREVTEICERLDIENVNVTALNKAPFKRIVMAACRSEDENIMKESMSKKEKTKGLVEEGFRMKEYMKMKSVYDSQELFRIRTSMNEIRGNSPLIG